MFRFLHFWVRFLNRQIPDCTLAQRDGMEACTGSHFWARELAGLGHTMRLMAPQYVKAYVKRQKNDRADAEAIC